ncbi:hypothetical protein L198_02515, partial [Cryptococcus wingfieldii CBS 7118]
MTGTPTADNGALSTSHSQTLDIKVSRRGAFGGEDHLVYTEEHGEEEFKPLRVRELVRPPVVRQWMEDGKLYREPSHHETPRIELFFDLLFVAIVHQLADAAIEEPGGKSVARFVLTFWPSFQTKAVPMMHLLHRVWVLIGMMTLIGYSANASAIEIHPEGEEEELDHSAVRAAVAFWLVIKLTRVVVLFYYALKLPKFRSAHIWKAVAVLVPMFVLLPLIWVTSRPAQIVLATLLIIIDIMRIDLIFLLIRGRIHAYRQRRQEGIKGLQAWGFKGWHRMPDVKGGGAVPVVNIEHATERLGAFIVIVLGEMVMNVVYTAANGEMGVSHEFGKAALGLMVAWALNYLYMLPSEPSAEYEHAFRRSWLTGVCFNFFHWPLSASLVLASAACGKMVANDEVETGVHWYWGCGVGFAMLFIALLDLTHFDLAPGEARIPRSIRAILCLAAALSLILFSFGTEHMPSTGILAITVGITWFTLAVSIYGQLPKPGGVTTQEREELERRR